MKTILQIIIGMTLLITGISLILVWWPEIIIVFKGVAGATLAVVGLIILYMAGSKKK